MSVAKAAAKDEAPELAPFGRRKRVQIRPNRLHNFRGEAHNRIHPVKEHACYRCERECSRSFSSCPTIEKGGKRCGSRAFYSGVRPTSVFCPADDPIAESASWEALLRITGQPATFARVEREEVA